MPSPPVDPSQPTILAFAPGPWAWPNFAGSPRYHLWMLASRGWNVVYVEPPRHLRLTARTWAAPDRPFRVLTPARVPPFAVRFAKTATLGDKWRNRTGSALAARGVAFANKLGLKPDIYWLGAPWHGAVLSALPKGPAAVHHVYDELSLSPALSPVQREFLWDWEREMLRSCAAVFCSSQPQMERRDELTNRPVRLPNGVRPEFLHDPEKPYPLDEEARRLLGRLEKLPRPRYAYGGVADHRLDPDLFRALLKRDREGVLVFLGKRDESFDKAFAAECDLHARVEFFGEMGQDVLAPLLRACDVLLIGHKRSPFTDAMLPEKLTEYLATGRPVVSVRLPEAARIMRSELNPPLLRVVDGADPWAEAAFEAASELDLRPDLQQQRVRWASRFTWDELAVGADRTLRTLLPKN